MVNGGPDITASFEPVLRSVRQVPISGHDHLSYSWTRLARASYRWAGVVISPISDLMEYRDIVAATDRQFTAEDRAIEKEQAELDQAQALLDQRRKALKRK